ncbi:aminoglycoside phosphotransferase family protein [Roseobacteraceae bacterium S113]
MTRHVAIQQFLAQAGWADAVQDPLAGDASTRAYIRLTRNGAHDDTAMLMDAPPASCGPMDSFVAIAAHLRAQGLSAPAIFAQDLALGLILMEDFGQTLMAQRATQRPEDEPALYGAAVDTLIALHAAPLPPGPAILSAHDLAQMIAPVFTHYAPQFDGAAATEATDWLAAALADLAQSAPSLALRDYHAENLVWRGDAPLGLLDFQDAVITHPAYDLASLLKDARRRIPERLEADMIARFVDGTGLESDLFQRGYRLIACQRNLRILGIFQRLAQDRGKPHYLAFQPIVWHHIQSTLAHPDLTPLSRILAHLPAPGEPR